MLDSVLRTLFLTIAGSRLLKRAASRYGMRGPGRFARRFIGGETVPEAIATVHELSRRGLTHTLNQLGEHVRTLEAAERASRDYVDTIEQVGRAGLPCKISVKLSQIGLELDPDVCTRHLRTLCDAAAHHGGFVRIDMEGSGLLDDTLHILSSMWDEGRHNVGIVLQSYLYRTADDLERMLELGVKVRLVKGAYQEPPELAYPAKSDVDAAFLRLATRLLEKGVDPAFATHDPRMIEGVRRRATARGIEPGDFEFQLLYGVRRDLQATLIAQGHRVRIYLPFGTDWFPYFMRRLAERPANVGYVVKSILYEQKGP